MPKGQHHQKPRITPLKDWLFPTNPARAYKAETTRAYLGAEEAADMRKLLVDPMKDSPSQVEKPTFFLWLKAYHTYTQIQMDPSAVVIQHRWWLRNRRRCLQSWWGARGAYRVGGSCGLRGGPGCCCGGQSRRSRLLQRHDGSSGHCWWLRRQSKGRIDLMRARGIWETGEEGREETEATREWRWRRGREFVCIRLRSCKVESARGAQDGRLPGRGVVCPGDCRGSWPKKQVKGQEVGGSLLVGPNVCSRAFWLVCFSWGFHQCSGVGGPDRMGSIYMIFNPTVLNNPREIERSWITSLPRRTTPVYEEAGVNRTSVAKDIGVRCETTSAFAGSRRCVSSR